MSVSTPQVTGLQVKDEGVTVANPANSMDFVGANVSVTASGSATTVTITGSTTNEVRNEVVTYAGPSFNALANTPTAGTVAFYKNGIRQILTTDYTISGGTITPSAATPFEIGAIYTADYLY